MKRPGPSAGGKAAGIIARAAAIKKYMLDPKTCRHCGSIILVGESKVSATKKKNFCNHSCAAKDANALPKRVRNPIPCERCGADIGCHQRKFCTECREKIRAERLATPKSKANRRSVAAMASYAAKKRQRVCEACGYSKHVEVCHVVAVKDFPETATVAEINAPENLRVLCPNCHWELDHPNS